MRESNDPWVTWLVQWLFRHMHDDPHALILNVDILVSKRLKNQNGTAFTAHKMPIYNGKSYRIRVAANLTDAEMARTLAHEVRHITQYETKRLAYKGGCPVWLGKKYAKNCKYWTRPWEVEARQSEYLGDEARKAYKAMQSAITGTGFLWIKERENVQG